MSGPGEHMVRRLGLPSQRTRRLFRSAKHLFGSLKHVSDSSGRPAAPWTPQTWSPPGGKKRAPRAPHARPRSPRGGSR